MKRHILFASLIIAAVVPAAHAQPNGRPMMARADIPTAAVPYLRAAASGDQFEIQSSQLALQMSHDRQVRQMAQMLITDHRRLSADTMAAARRSRISPPPAMLTPEHMAMLRDLRQARPGQFDMAFNQAQIAAHQEALALHRGYAERGDVPALRATAAKAVPVVEMHLREAQQHQHM